MTIRFVRALLCGGLLAFMTTAAVTAEERKPRPGIDVTGRQFFPEDNKNQKGRKVLVKPDTKKETIFDRWGNQIQ